MKIIEPYVELIDKLRTDKAAHPQMRFVAGKILEILRDKLPVIAEDITP